MSEMKKETIIVTANEMMDLYYACKRVLDLLWKHRKNSELVFEYLDFQTMGEFCEVLSTATEGCSTMLNSFRKIIGKYDIVFPELEHKN